LTARLAGLRAWLCFDLDQHRQAERWYALGVSAAQEAEEWALAAWLVGASSLMPWLRRDHGRVVGLIEHGLYLASNGADASTVGWLHGLHARGYAGLGDRRAFEAASSAAKRAAEHSMPDDRRHGMDFDQERLDLRYYLGTGWLLLQQSAKATALLQESMDALPAAHIKAQAVLGLLLAEAAAQRREFGVAVDLSRQALNSTEHHPILPILHQARRVQTMVLNLEPEKGVCLGEDIHRFAAAMAAANGGAPS
jgi:hypothetical protein